MHLHFAGLARDCAATIQMNISSLIGIAEQPGVESASLIIAENNSSDQTREILLRLESISQSIYVLPLGDLDSLYPIREARLAFCRDRLIERIADDIDGCANQEQSTHIYIPVDLDSEIGSSISPIQFIKECSRVAEGSANGIFPASAPFYYDIHALRAEGWVESNCWEQLHQFINDNDAQSYDDYFFANIVLKQKSLGELQQQRLIPVKSAFGGIGIYNFEAVKNIHYFRDELQQGRCICEHAVFNRQIDKLFISTEFIVKAPVEHIRDKHAFEERMLFALTAVPNKLHDSPSLTRASSTSPMHCRLCGEVLTPVFRKQLLRRHDVQYFQCSACRAMQTESPYWLAEAYSPENERFDTGSVTRSIINAAFLNWLVSALDAPALRLLDYGCGSGLLVRLLRDVGHDAWGLDSYSEPRLSTGFQVDDPSGFDIINLCEVIEHFDRPSEMLDSIFASNPSIVVVQTEIMADPDPSWSYLAGFHGQHVFFLSDETIHYIARRYSRQVCVISGFLLFVSDSISLKLLDVGAGDFRTSMPDLHSEAAKLINSVLSQPYRYPLVDFNSAMKCLGQSSWTDGVPNRAALSDSFSIDKETTDNMSIDYRYRDVSVPEREQFVDWLRLAVPRMTHQGNERAFEFVAMHLDSNAPVLEIGSFCGLSTILIGHYLKKYHKNNRIITCDKWEFEGQKLGMTLGGSSLLTHDEYKHFVKDLYMKNVSSFLPGNIPFTIEQLSDDFFDLWGASSTTNDVFNRSIKLGGDIAFCFIDGNHQYEFAKRDFMNTDMYLIPGGFVLFDDSGDGTDWDVNRLAREIERDERYEIIARNPNYLFRKR